MDLPPEIWFKVFDYLLHDMTEKKLPDSAFARVRVRLVFLKIVSTELNRMCKAFIKTIPKSGLQRRPDIMEYLAENTYLSCLAFMHEIGAKWTNGVIESALSNNDFKTVNYVVNNSTNNRWDYKSCLSMAMQYGCLEAIKYFHDATQDWMGLTCTKIVERSSIQQLECLQYAHEKGCPFDEDTCDEAVLHGDLNCVKFIHENGGSWTYHATDNAASTGNIQCLKYLLENGCPRLSSVYLNCAETGDIDMMKYLYENTTVNWHEKTCYTAAQNNHMECLRYAYDHDAPFNDRIIVYACKTTECLQFVHDAGYGWNVYICRENSPWSVMMSQYAHDQGWCTCRYKQ